MFTNFKLNFLRFPWLALCLFSTALPCWAINDDEEQIPTISVTGTAEVGAVPNEVVLTFSIESREEKLDDAVHDNDERIKAVTAFLRESKVEAKHIRTEVISIRPIFETEDKYPVWKGQIAQLPVQNAAPKPPIVVADKKKKIKPIGYIARRQLAITIKDLKSFEDVYRGLVAKGVNDVGGIKFQTTELRRYKDEARLKAVRAAREKASAMASELGATLASVQTITENSGSYFSNRTQNVMSAVAFGESDSSIAAGEIKITASVHVVFRLGETELKK